MKPLSRKTWRPGKPLGILSIISLGIARIVFIVAISYQIKSLI